MKQISSLYLHFPFCRHLCNYCDFYKHKLQSFDQVKEFENKLIEQFQYHENYLNHQGFKLSNLDTLYLGGGTPSLWPGAGANILKEEFDRLNIRLTSNTECTLEIDPNAWNDNDINSWEKFGVNRYSVGVQTFNEKLLKIMDRGHDLAAIEKLLKYLYEKEVNYSVDLMLGLPSSENRNLKNEIDQILKYGPNHLSVYILKTRSNYPHNKNLPDDERIRDEYLFVSDYLKVHGFKHYEVSNFAKSNYESKHNKKYWAYESVAGIGPNATGLLVNDTHSTRYQWKSKSLGVTEEIIEGESLVIEQLFLGLRRSEPFDMTKIFQSVNDLSNMNILISNWVKAGYIEESSRPVSIKVTKLGFLMSDSLLDDIFKKITF